MRPQLINLDRQAFLEGAYYIVSTGILKIIKRELASSDPDTLNSHSMRSFNVPWSIPYIEKRGL